MAKTALPSAVETARMGVPTKSVDGTHIASIVEYSKHVNLYFYNGAKLSSKLLEGTGKAMHHVKFTATSEVNQKVIERLLR